MQSPGKLSFKGVTVSAREPDGSSQPARRHRLTLVAALLLGSWLCSLKLLLGPGTVVASAAALGLSYFETSYFSLGGLVMVWALAVCAVTLPSVAPSAVAFDRLSKLRGARLAALILFSAGYAWVWLCLSGVLAATQWALQQTLPDIGAPLMSGSLLLVAGAFQFTPLKDSCLRRCRSPLHLKNPQPGHVGALLTGFKTGGYCAGCGGLLVALVWLGGIANLPLIIGLATYLITEKLVPQRFWLERLSGAALMLWGIAVMAF